MNKNVKLFTVLSLAASMCFCACSKDDEGGSSEVPNNAGEISKDMPGLKISSVGSNRFYYDEQGKLTSAYMNGSNIKFENGFNFSDYEGQYSLTVNGSGLVTGASVSSSDSGDGWSETGTGTASIAYNGNQQITKVVTTSSWKGVEDGERYSVTEKSETTVTYDSKGRILKVVNTWSEVDDHKDSGSETYTFEYGDYSYDNKYGQYTPKLVDRVFDMGSVEALCYAGLFGKSTMTLPTKIMYEEEEYCEEDGDTETYSGNISCGPYTFNSNGTIKSADGYSYTYTSLDTKAVFAVDEMQAKDKASSNRMSRRHSHRHSK